MGLKLNGRYISLILAVQIVRILFTEKFQKAARVAGNRRPRAAVSMSSHLESYPQILLHTAEMVAVRWLCGALGEDGFEARRGLFSSLLLLRYFGYWDDFHACTLTALTDCQEGATDLWEKLRRESKNLDFQGSLFELCGGGSGAAPSLLPPALPLLLAALWAALVTWLPF
ncbi:PREDICTED: neuritin [Charadrius vociferus]|uniref:neuritin n=1 Tax=Charadrius vociferus TaxID=50402 RepID=UPI0005215C3E|nr:PREDICTED: neuritin [Charadrius vociferus]